jgi:hypothetical protein
MPTLIINRDSGYADSLRAYKLLLDGHEVGKIRGGESKSFTVSAGEHTIRAKIDWCSSPSESFVAADETVSFEVFSKLRGIRLLGAIFAIFNPNGYIGIRRLNTLQSNATYQKEEGEQDVHGNTH